MIDLLPIYELEARARMAGFSVAALLERAGVHRSTWQRWKSGDAPMRGKKWDAIVAVIAQSEDVSFKRHGSV